MILVVCAIIVLFSDQCSKFAVQKTLNIGESLPVLKSYFSLSLVHNYGAAFGLFQHQLWLFVGLTFVSFILILWIYFIYGCSNKSAKISLGLILGGALGNLADRLHHGYVVDFLDFYIGKYHWPSFNLADAAICIGVGVLMLFLMFAHEGDVNVSKVA